jgi:hypothetical protein
LLMEVTEAVIGVWGADRVHWWQVKTKYDLSRIGLQIFMNAQSLANIGICNFCFFWTRSPSFFIWRSTELAIAIRRSAIANRKKSQKL